MKQPDPLHKPKKRDLFAELNEGFDALANARAGKLTLRQTQVRVPARPEVQSEELLQIRERMNVSRAVMANRLRTNVRTLESWEQGRSRPNAQAALMIRMVSKYPETLERLATL